MDKFSLSTLAVIGVGRDEAVEALAGAGFAQIELGADEEYLGNWMTDVAGTERLLRAAGLQVRSLHSSVATWRCGATDEAVRRGAVATGKENLDLAGALGRSLWCSMRIRRGTTKPIRQRVRNGRGRVGRHGRNTRGGVG